MPAPAEVWPHNWAERILERIGELGFASIADFLAAAPAQPYPGIAAMLGAWIAPIQVISLHFSEARRNGTVREAAMDSLARSIVERFPDGWGIGEDPAWQCTSALASWISELVATGGFVDLQPVLLAIARDLELSQPATGWVPSGVLDPVICAAFDRHWPAGNSTNSARVERV